MGIYIFEKTMVLRSLKGRNHHHSAMRKSMSPSPQLSHHHMLHSHQVPMWSERSTYSLPECGKKDAEMTPRHSAGIERIHTWFSMRARLPTWITAQGYLVFRKLVIVVSVLQMVANHFPGTVNQFYEYTIT